MLNLYDYMIEEINPICECYSDEYPQDKEAAEGKKVYPYATILMYTGIPNNEYSNNNLIYIDIWSNQHGITEVETLTDDIYNKLNKLKIMKDDMYLQIFRNNPCRLNLNDSDVNIKRRQLRFLVKTYEINQ
jgi:hypothetical protein